MGDCAQGAEPQARPRELAAPSRPGLPLGMQQVLRQAILRSARRHGLEGRLRAVQFAAGGKAVRRNYRDDNHLRLLLRLTLAEDAACLDVGANVGAILETIVASAPRGRHIAYEPLPVHASELAERFPSVDVRCAAVSREPGERTFRRVIGAEARSGFDADGDDEYETEELSVKVEALDSSLPPDFAPAVVKIDVEGAELEVIEGGIGLISEHRPLVALEHGGPLDHSAEIHRLLCGRAGLRAFDMDGKGPLDLDAFVAAVASGERWNFVFHA
jgi:FkbM family methyltransferase